MAETDDARAAKAPALKPENTNPNTELAKKPPSKVREEGELSSSDEDDDVLSSKSLSEISFYFLSSSSSFSSAVLCWIAEKSE